MLTELDQATLDMENSWWKFQGAKETAIRERFDETPVRYYQRLDALLDNPHAAAYAPLVVGRLRRLREVRAEARGSRPRD